MRRAFVIVQISDLHFDGNGKRVGSAEVLGATLAQKMQEFRSIPDRILIITGDLIQSADKSADRQYAEFDNFLDEVRRSNAFSDVLIIAGNHDVKKSGIAIWNDDFYKRYNVSKTAESKYFRRAGLDLVLVDSNKSVLATGNVSSNAYNEMISNTVKLSQAITSGFQAEKNQHIEPEQSIVRVLALHHHPLPLADGEGIKVLGLPDEPMMYLASPATFLDAALSINVDLILHGHRHVQGFTRYSVQNRSATTSEIAEEFWRTIYVLSCPSSTGADCDAGFNIINFTDVQRFGRASYEFQITRYTRYKNAGNFEPLDRISRGIIHIPLGDSYHRDIALQIEIEISSSGELTREDLTEHARRLLTRRAFYNQSELAWPFAFYAYLVTYNVWTNVLLPAVRSTPIKRDHDVVADISGLIWSLVEHAATILGIDGFALDSLRNISLSNQRDFMKRIPQHVENSSTSIDADKKRASILLAIDQKLENFCGKLSLGGRPRQPIPD